VIARDPFRALGLRRPREADGAPRLTEKQKETRTLQTMGVDLNRLTQREGSALIGEAIRRRELGLCSLAQVRTLAKHGIDGRLVTFLEAGRVLSAIASNGWRANKQIRDSVKRVEEPGRAPARMAV